MLSNVFSGAILATVLGATIVSAQSIAQLGGPSNYPPASFTGQQFVDGRGCVFLRAGYGNNTNWVPRVDRSHKPLCGFPPTFGAQVAAALQADMAPEAPATMAPTPAPSTGPAPTVFSSTKPVAAQPAPAPQIAMVAAAPYVASSGPAPTVYKSAPAAPLQLAFVAPAATYQTAAASSASISCFTNAPNLERVLLQNGGTALVCTRGDGTLSGWRSPLFAQANGVGAALSNPALNSTTMAGAVVVGGYATRTVAPPIVVARTAIPTPPKGYKSAWKDDRLNPLRGVGTPQGQAAQDQVWTRTVPMVLITAPIVRAPVLQTSASTMSAPAARTGAAYVQVGSFGQPANVTNASARLTALGLPVATAKVTRSGKVIQIVYAGPFTSTAAAQSALATVRGAGFGDAILK
ncbi:MAG: SPOR domain-containing protein [Paracoccaceae bacterium]